MTDAAQAKWTAALQRCQLLNDRLVRAAVGGFRSCTFLQAAPLCMDNH
jgi:hypothetical protein